MLDDLVLILTSRHASTVVVYDERSKQLALREIGSREVKPAECPTCHRPYEEDTNHPANEGGACTEDRGNSDFLNPGYFRMLQHSLPASPAPSRPITPSQQLQREARDLRSHVVDPPRGAEFVSSTPSTAGAGGISSSAFSPGYFQRFFVEEGELGRGGKGVVLLVRHMLDRVSLGQFACKRVPVGDDHAWLEKVLVEVQLLQHLSHQNLVSYRHVWLQDYQITKFGPSVPCAFILQQYCNGGDLQRYVLNSGADGPSQKEQLKNRMRRRSKGILDPPIELKAHRNMPFDEISSFFQDITSGLHHLHVHGYIHRDLKPQNCLLHREGTKIRVLVSDFGEMQTESQLRTSSGATGTVAYCAPEVLRRTSTNGAFGNFTAKSDVFSLGMIVYFMCFGKLPYSSADQINEETEDIDQLRDEISAWHGVSDEVKNRNDLPELLFTALKRLLALDPAERPSTDEILQALLNNRAPSPHATAERRPSYTGTPPGLGERRISSLDSPAPTPQRGPSLRGRQNSLIRTAPSLPSSGLPYQAYASPGPPSPTRDTARSSSRDDEGSEELALIRSRHTSPVNRSYPPTSPPQPATTAKRLALPAPPSRFAVKDSVLSSHHWLTTFKLSLFILKYLSLTRPCSPFASNGYITYPLLMLAAFDFALPVTHASVSPHDTRKSLALLLLHFVVVFLASRTGQLCNTPSYML